MTVISNDKNVLTENLITVRTNEEVDSRIFRHAINLRGNNYKEVSIQTVDSDVVLSFGYAKIVEDVGVETFSLIF